MNVSEKLLQKPSGHCVVGREIFALVLSILAQLYLSLPNNDWLVFIALSEVNKIDMRGSHTLNDSVSQGAALAQRRRQTNWAWAKVFGISCTPT